MIIGSAPTPNDTSIQKETCAGLFFRCSSSQYVYLDDRNRLVYGERHVMRQLMKESCDGCQYCSALVDEISEATNNGKNIDIRPNIELGARYRLEFVDISWDEHSGVIDDCSLAFVKVEDPK